MNGKTITYLLYGFFIVVLIFTMFRVFAKRSKQEIKNDYIGQPRAGDIFYSKYFDANGMVVEYKDDNNWWFILSKNGQFSQPVLKAKCKPYEVSWVQRMREV